MIFIAGVKMRRQDGNNSFGRRDNDGPRRNDRFGQKRDGGRDFGRRDSGPKQMHRVECDKCGKSCEVPFRPTGDKPVYCSDCFRRNEKSDQRRPSRDNSELSASISKKDLDEINQKLDSIMVALGIE